MKIKSLTIALLASLAMAAGFNSCSDDEETSSVANHLPKCRRQQGDCQQEARQGYIVGCLRQHLAKFIQGIRQNRRSLQKAV